MLEDVIGIIKNGKDNEDKTGIRLAMEKLRGASTVCVGTGLFIVVHRTCKMVQKSDYILCVVTCLTFVFQIASFAVRSLRSCRGLLDAGNDC